MPPIEGLKEAGFITNEEVFELKDLPERLVVLGGKKIKSQAFLYRNRLIAACAAD